MEAYFEKGSVEAPVISNSALSALNPEQGGSIIKFLSFFREDEEKKNSLSLERGKLIHKYIEDKDKFVIADFVAPTEMMGKLIKECVRVAANLPYDQLKGVDTVVTSNNKVERNKAAEILETQGLYEKLSGFLGLNTEDTIRVFRVARKTTASYMKQAEATVLGNIVGKENEIKYLQFLKSTINKIVLTEAEKNSVEGATHSLYNHPQVSKLLGLQTENADLDGVSEGQEIIKVEFPIYWDQDVEVVGFQKRIQVECKALLDRLIVDHVNKIIHYIDLKTTGNSIYLFEGSFKSYHYYRQMAFYRRAIAEWFKIAFPGIDPKIYRLIINIVPVETNGNFLTCIYDVSKPWLLKGQMEFQALCSRYAWHKATGEYHYSLEEIQNGGILKFKDPE